MHDLVGNEGMTSAASLCSTIRGWLLDYIRLYQADIARMGSSLCVLLVDMSKIGAAG